MSDYKRRAMLYSGISGEENRQRVDSPDDRRCENLIEVGGDDKNPILYEALPRELLIRY